MEMKQYKHTMNDGFITFQTKIKMTETIWYSCIPILEDCLEKNINIKRLKMGNTE